MTNIEAMKQALDALEIVVVDVKTTPNAYEAQRQAITALREKLAQPEQEPVAWANEDDLGKFDMRVRTNCDYYHTMPLYTTPPAAQRQPLTKERIGQIIEQCKITLVNYCSGEKQTEFARAIEAEHGIKEKNT